MVNIFHIGNCSNAKGDLQHTVSQEENSVSKSCKMSTAHRRTDDVAFKAAWRRTWIQMFGFPFGKILTKLQNVAR